ncbi:phosphatase PAP2 family protein [Streptomyces sp. NPDC001348]
MTRTLWAGTLAVWTAFGVLTMVVAGHGGPLLPDRDLLSWSLAHRPPVAVAVARGLTGTGTGVVPYTLAVLAGLLAARTPRQRPAAAVLAVACLGTGQSLRFEVMELVARLRPPRYDWQTHASGWSYPSGHTTTAALTAGLLCLAVWVRAPHGRVPLCLAVGCWGASVGLTRIFLGVHWFTDVVGGWLFAAGWLGVCVCAGSRWLAPGVVAGGREPTGPAEPAPVRNSPDVTDRG